MNIVTLVYSFVICINRRSIICINEYTRAKTNHWKQRNVRTSNLTRICVRLHTLHLIPSLLRVSFVVVVAVVVWGGRGACTWKRDAKRACKHTRAARSIIDKGRVEKACANGETAGKEGKRDVTHTMVGTRRERKREGMMKRWREREWERERERGREGERADEHTQR